MKACLYQHKSPEGKVWSQWIVVNDVIKRSWSYLKPGWNDFQYPDVDINGDDIHKGIKYTRDLTAAEIIEHVF